MVEILRVGYDEQIFLAQARGGISRYFVELIKAFRADGGLGVTAVPGWKWSPNGHARDAGLSKPIPLLGPSRGSAAAYFAGNALPRRRARKAQILHHTYYHPLFLKPRVSGRRACTVYDMIPELFPDSFNSSNPHLAKHRYVEECELLFCISESTRQDLVQVYGDPGRPIAVVPLGVDPIFSPSRIPPPGLPHRFVLFVGKRSGYKDFGVLVEAFASLPATDLVLLTIGHEPFTDAELNTFSRFGISDRVKHRAATDGELAGIYPRALTFVFPSRYEGFGLPTLEAMASGTPVILADASSHPEVGGDAARYFPPGDPAALASQLERVLEDDVQRAALVARGLSRVTQFSWRATAELTAAVYRTAVS